MLRKGVIHLVHSKGSHFLNILFLVPKKDGVINLKTLKSFISYSHFKMEGFVKRSSEGEQFYVQGGLEKSYFCVPLHKNHQKFLRFQWKGNIYGFLRLCLGLDPAPRIFRKLYVQKTIKIIKNLITRLEV